MRKSIYQNLTKKEVRQWEQQKEKEWEKNADFWIKIIRENLDPFRLVVTNKAILELLRKEKKLKILDAGCGEGYLCRSLAKLGHRVFGIDFCPKLIEAAKNLERKRPLGIKYFIGDFRKTDFPSSFFDAILSHQTINEIPDPEKAFKEFSRILKRGGKLVCLFLHPCFEIQPQKNISLAATYFQKTKIKKEYYLVSGIKSPSPYFYLHLPLSEWIEILTKNGFIINEIKEPHPPLKILKKDKWWKENFKKPLFILIKAVKI
jgi:2-polyprenyl-3-methyl-5-hydroxy-6-metoxy-1,4-benzoquinol methylase